MALACQKDSYLRQITTTVKSCEPSQINTVINGKKQKRSGFDVIVEDTVLFPEGGGQPDDRGTLNQVEVLRVTRRGAEAVHFVPTPFDPGSEVTVSVDWARRWDHMQQHSGQHLITAIADGKFGYATTSWNLGDKTSFIELSTPNMSAQEVEEVEILTNQKIREGSRMYPTLYTSKDDPKVQEVRTRGLPEDHVGPIRVVTIEGVETNMCCGTHVSRLSHLQAVKLLYVEKAKTKGRVNLVFVVGDRVLQYLGQAHSNERALTALLRGGPDQHVELVEKMQKSFKTVQKSAVTLLRDVAIMEAERFKAQPSPLLSLHRKEGDNEFMNIIVNEIADKNVLIFITTGDDKGQGLFMLSGSEEDVCQLGPRVAEIIEGKGAGRNGRFQGKANRLSKRPQAEQLLRDSTE